MEGSWNTIETSSPRIGRRSFADLPSSSSSRSLADPVTAAVGGSRPSIARELTDLPDPDSPTTATTSPGATSKLMPRTAWTVPASVLKSTVRSRRLRVATRRSASGSVGAAAGASDPSASTSSANSVSISFSSAVVTPPRVRSSGLRMSLRLSPIRVEPSTISTMAVPGNTPVHQMPDEASGSALLRS